MSEKPDVDRRKVLGAIAGAALAAPGIANAVNALIPAAGGDAAQRENAEAQNQPHYYPPTRQGMRGNHPGSFEGAQWVNCCAREASCGIMTMVS